MGLDMDFAKLAPQDVLDLAVYAENEAQESYQELADLMKRRGNDDVAGFFHLMAGVEGRHRDQIAAKRQARYTGKPRHLTDRAFWEVEVPNAEAAEETFTLRDALELSLEAEINAHDYYANAIDYVTDPEILELFEELRMAEEAHQRMVRAQIAKLG